MIKAVLLGVLAVFVSVPAVSAAENCVFASNGDYICGESVSNAPKKAKKPSKHTFFSNPDHPVLKKDLNFDESAFAAPIKPGPMTPIDPKGYTLEQLGKRMDKIYKVVGNMSPRMQEIAVEKIMAEMTLEEIANYKGPVVSRGAGGRKFMGRPLR